LEAIHLKLAKCNPENGILAIIHIIITGQEGWTTLEGVGAWKWHNK